MEQPRHWEAYNNNTYCNGEILLDGLQISEGAEVKGMQVAERFSKSETNLEQSVEHEDEERKRTRVKRRGRVQKAAGLTVAQERKEEEAKE